MVTGNIPSPLPSQSTFNPMEEPSWVPGNPAARELAAALATAAARAPELGSAGPASGGGEHAGALDRTGSRGGSAEEQAGQRPDPDSPGSTPRQPPGADADRAGAEPGSPHSWAMASDDCELGSGGDALPSPGTGDPAPLSSRAPEDGRGSTGGGRGGTGGGPGSRAEPGQQPSREPEEEDGESEEDYRSWLSDDEGMEHTLPASTPAPAFRASLDRQALGGGQAASRSPSPAQRVDWPAGDARRAGSVVPAGPKAQDEHLVWTNDDGDIDALPWDMGRSSIADAQALFRGALAATAAKR